MRFRHEQIFQIVLITSIKTIIRNNINSKKSRKNKVNIKLKKNYKIIITLINNKNTKIRILR